MANGSTVALEKALSDMDEALSSLKAAASGTDKIDDEIVKLREENSGLKLSLSARFDEVARLTEIFQTLSDENKSLKLKIEEIRTLNDESNKQLSDITEQLRDESNYKKYMATAVGMLMGKMLTVSRGYTLKNPLEDSELSELANKLKAANIFDEDWYLSRYPDIKNVPNPALHYVRWGVFEKRIPCSFGKVVSKLRREGEQTDSA